MVASMNKILVSACLLGQPVRYDGGALTLKSTILERWIKEGRIIPLCPEVLAGFAIPRQPAEIEKGKEGVDVLAGKALILENTGTDVTDMFIRGAEIALQIAKKNDCQFALLTDGSPSCGTTFIYGGTFDGQHKTGQGVVASLLSDNGIQVFPEDKIQLLDGALQSR